MRSLGILKVKDHSYSIQTIEFPLLEDKELFELEDQSMENNLSLEDAIKLYPELGILIKESENKAKEIIQKAYHEAEIIKERGVQSGYEAGYEIAMKEMQESSESLSNIFKQGIDEIVSLKDRILSQSESDIVRLSMEIAKKLVSKELNQDPSIIINIVTKAIELVQNNSGIIIKVNPNDYEILQKSSEQLISWLSEIRPVPIKIEKDPEISQGGCFIETDTGLIDMSLETRFKLLDNLLLNTDS